MKKFLKKLLIYLNKKKFLFLTYLKKPFFGKIEKGTIIIKPLLIVGYKNIFLEKNIFIRNGARIEAVENWGSEKYNPKLIIKEGVSIEQNVHLTFCNELIIGKNTCISANVMITDIDHEYKIIGEHILNQPLINKKTKIGENCFIGLGAKIMAGTNLGKQCIVGINTVVLKGEYPDYSVIVGIPGKIVKKYNIETEQWESVR
ncbi:MAG: acyltransferase [Cetobacterium sp.]|uniref:acyltransferase n=1 Tax=Cetobacterium sp. TaxID=2071632 RepID=UPI003EE6740E